MPLEVALQYLYLCSIILHRIVLPSLDSKHDWWLLCQTVVIVSDSGYSKCLMQDDVVMEVNNQVNCIVMAYFCLLKVYAQ